MLIDAKDVKPEKSLGVLFGVFEHDVKRLINAIGPCVANEDCCWTDEWLPLIVPYGAVELHVGAAHRGCFRDDNFLAGSLGGPIAISWQFACDEALEERNRHAEWLEH